MTTHPDVNREQRINDFAGMIRRAILVHGFENDKTAEKMIDECVIPFVTIGLKRYDDDLRAQDPSSVQNPALSREAASLGYWLLRGGSIKESFGESRISKEGERLMSELVSFGFATRTDAGWVGVKEKMPELAMIYESHAAGNDRLMSRSVKFWERNPEAGSPSP